MKTRLMQIRKNAGYKNREEVADELVMSASTYRDWEMGRTDIKASDLCMLADFFDVSVDYLLGRDIKRDYDDPRERELHEVWDSCCDERKDLLRRVALELRKAENFERAYADTIVIGDNNIVGSNNAVGGTVVSAGGDVSANNTSEDNSTVINSYN